MSLRVLLGCSWVLFGALGVLLGWFWGALEVLLACSLMLLGCFWVLVGVLLGALRARVGWWVSGRVVLGVFLGALGMLSKVHLGCSWDL